MIVTPHVDPAVPSGKAPGDTPPSPDGPFGHLLANALHDDGAPDQPRLDGSGTDAEQAVADEGAPEAAPDDAVAVPAGLPAAMTPPATEPELPPLLAKDLTPTPPPEVAASGQQPEAEQASTDAANGNRARERAEPLANSTLAGQDGALDLTSTTTSLADTLNAAKQDTNAVGQLDVVSARDAETGAVGTASETGGVRQTQADHGTDAAGPNRTAIDTARNPLPNTSPTVVGAPAIAEEPGATSGQQGAAARATSPTAQVEVTTTSSENGAPTPVTGPSAQHGEAVAQPGPAPGGGEAPAGSLDVVSASPPQQTGVQAGDHTRPDGVRPDTIGVQTTPPDASDMVAADVDTDTLPTGADDTGPAASADTASGRNTASSGDPIGQPAPNDRRAAATAATTTTTRSDAQTPPPEAIPSPGDAPATGAVPAGQTINLDLSAGAPSVTAQPSGSSPTQPTSALPATLQTQLDEMRQTGEAQRRLVVRLDPPELGSVVLELVNTGDELVITARTDTQDAVRALMRQREELQTVIETLGMTLAEFDVREESQQDQEQQRRSSRVRATGLFADPDATDLATTHDHEGALFL